MACVEAGVPRFLPVIVGARGAEQVYVEVPPTLDDQACVGVAGVDDVQAGQEVFPFQGAMDGRGRGAVRDRGSGRLDVGDEVRPLVVARFCEMDLVVLCWPFSSTMRECPSN